MEDILLTATLKALLIAAVCSVSEPENECTYTVTCYQHAGSVQNPTCAYNLNVTFIIADVENDFLSKAFFGSTNFDARVRYLRAFNNSWATIDEVAFVYYTKITHADLSNNKIKVIGKKIFKNHNFMKVLNFSNNRINDTLWINRMFYDDGDNKMPVLQVIDISFNKINYLEKNFLEQLPNLQEIYLNNNDISSIHENAFAECNNMIKIDLRHNKLTQLGRAFIKVKNVEIFLISFNSLENIANNEISEMTSLKHINLSHNSIKSIHVLSLSRAFHLVSLDLSSNFLSDTISSLMFINNGLLTDLNLYNNSLSSIQDGTFNHTSIEHLDINMNNLTGSISTRLFSGLNKVKSLEIMFQNITNIDTGAFSDMRALTYCNLSSNRIKTIDQASFSGANNITILDVSNNIIITLDFISKCSGCFKSLELIYLQNNEISIIDEESFVNNPNVIKLDLSGNKIYQIHSLPLGKLQYLNLKGNILNETLDKSIFSPSRYLSNLDLSNFNITLIKNEVFEYMPTLAKLNLSHNSIEFINPNNFFNMNNLYSLDLSHNQLLNFTINVTNSLLNLKALYLNNNKFKTFAIASNMSALIYLDLSNNYISDISSIAFQFLTRLQVLLISHNKLSYFNHASIDLLPLVSLDISHNEVTRINISNFNSIVSLNASYNQIDILNSSYLNDKYLQSLDISGNQLTDIPPGTFKNVKILKFLSLVKNRLSTLHYGSFLGLQKAEVLDLSNNEITTLDVNMFHECPEMRKIFIDFNRIRYFDGEQLLEVLPKLYSISLGGNPLACKEIIRNIKNINKTKTRYVDITSADKVFHEDNVNGIKCKAHDDIAIDNNADSISHGHSNWVAILSVFSIIFVIVGGTIIALKICLKKYQMYIPQRFTSVYSASAEYNN